MRKIVDIFKNIVDSKSLEIVSSHSDKFLGQFIDFHYSGAKKKAIRIALNKGIYKIERCGCCDNLYSHTTINNGNRETIFTVDI